MPIKVTSYDLIVWGAKINCRDFEIFQKEWPDGVEITAKNIRRAVELELDVNFVALRVLSVSARNAYIEARVSARKAYNEAMAPAWKVYDEAVVREFIKQLGLK